MERKSLAAKKKARNHRVSGVATGNLREQLSGLYEHKQ